jgi:hypothetical protein
MNTYETYEASSTDCTTVNTLNPYYCSICTTYIDKEVIVVVIECIESMDSKRGSTSSYLGRTAPITLGFGAPIDMGPRGDTHTPPSALGAVGAGVSRLDKAASVAGLLQIAVNIWTALHDRHAKRRTLEDRVIALEAQLASTQRPAVTTSRVRPRRVYPGSR